MKYTPKRCIYNLFVYHSVVYRYVVKAYQTSGLPAKIKKNIFILELIPESAQGPILNGKIDVLKRDWQDNMDSKLMRISCFTRFLNVLFPSRIDPKFSEIDLITIDF